MCRSWMALLDPFPSAPRRTLRWPSSTSQTSVARSGSRLPEPVLSKVVVNDAVSRLHCLHVMSTRRFRRPLSFFSLLRSLQLWYLELVILPSSSYLVSFDCVDESHPHISSSWHVSSLAFLSSLESCLMLFSVVLYVGVTSCPCIMSVASCHAFLVSCPRVASWCRVCISSRVFWLIVVAYVVPSLCSS